MAAKERWGSWISSILIAIILIGGISLINLIWFRPLNFRHLKNGRDPKYGIGGEPFFYQNYPVNPLAGVPSSLPRLLTSNHKFTSKGEIKIYFARWKEFETKFNQELKELPVFRKVATFNAYLEGWALYAEQLMFESGYYKNDPFGILGRFQSEMNRACRFVVDPGQACSIKLE